MNKSQRKRKSRRDRRHQQQDTLSKSTSDVEVADSIEPDTTSESDSTLCDNELISIKRSDVMGRYVVAARDLEAGTIIIQEKPLVVGPCGDTPAVCLGCYYNLDKDKDLTSYKCKGCGWPLCSSRCPGLHRPHGHTSTECTTLGATGGLGAGQWYAAITPLRCLLLERTDPSAYRQLRRMASLDEVRRRRPALWQANEAGAVERIVRAWHVTPDSELVHTVCGILEVNAFEVGQRGVSVRALYPSAFLFAHDCVPNTTHTDADGFRLTVRASMPVAAGRLVTLSYAYTLQSTMQRRAHLFETKFFWCECARCRDPTELATDAGTMLCPRCRGPVLATAPLDIDAPWACTSKGPGCAGYTVSANTVRLLMDKISDEVEAIDGNDVSSFEGFLQRYRNVLHSNHYQFLGVKHSLSQLYGKITGYMIHELPSTLLNRKTQICRDILRMFDVLEPGLSRIRGVTLYELHAPLMILATRDFELQTISKHVLRERLKEVVRCLKEAATILSFEPENSAEGVMASAAKDALLRIRDWEKILGKISS